MARSPFMMQTPGWGASPNDGTFLDLRDHRTPRTSVLVTAAQQGAEQGLKTIMGGSAVAGEGKTTTAASLAVVLAQSTPRGEVIRARAHLDQVGARIIGSVPNEVESITGYAYHGQDMAEPPDDDGASNAKGRMWGRRRDRIAS